MLYEEDEFGIDFLGPNSKQLKRGRIRANPIESILYSIQALGHIKLFDQ